VRQPIRAAASAASIPAWPLPTTTTSYSVGSLNINICNSLYTRHLS